MRLLLGGLAAIALFGAAAGAHAAPAANTKTAYKVIHQDGASKSGKKSGGLAPMGLMKATLYHFGAKGVGNKDSLGCRPVAMRTVAVDPTMIPRRTILFIAETVGLTMPDGSKHDGYWYASDTGGAIKGHRIDLFTGQGKASMKPAYKLNLAKLSVSKAGTFTGCPPAE
jgi:3D (Asp-Asp-Asp) domain-containing protein